MNISLDAFTKLCAEHIRQHEPILAYRHSSGWGLLKLYTVTPEPSYIITGTTIAGKAYVMRAETSAERDRLLREARQKAARIGEIEEIPGKEHKVKAATVKAMRKAIEFQSTPPVMGATRGKPTAIIPPCAKAVNKITEVVIRKLSF